MVRDSTKDLVLYIVRCVQLPVKGHSPVLAVSEEPLTLLLMSGNCLQCVRERPLYENLECCYASPGAKSSTNIVGARHGGKCSQGGKCMTTRILFQDIYDKDYSLYADGAVIDG